MRPRFRVELLVATPSGPVALTAERSALLLPRGPDGDGPKLYYGPYLNALSSFLARDSHRPLREALEKHLERTVDSTEIEKVELISEKHGALYNVSRVRVFFEGEKSSSMAVNVAARPEQQAFLENEFNLLGTLRDRFELSFLPRPYVLGIAPYRGETGGSLDLELFIAEWFEGFYEFHLSKRPEEKSPVLRVWNHDSPSPEPAGLSLDPEQSRSLYKQAASILTGYFDEKSFNQIYPWHNAAGDFIVKPKEGEVELKLVTARDYRSLLDCEPAPENIWIALMHFFLNLTLRLRLDRLDGTGELAWASEQCLRPITAGFIEAWAKKVQRAPELPEAGAVVETLRSLKVEEWHALSELVVEDGLVEADEAAYIEPRIGEHVAALYNVLREGEF